jgi:hypothetical protein
MAVYWGELQRLAPKLHHYLEFLLNGLEFILFELQTGVKGLLAVHKD